MFSVQIFASPCTAGVLSPSHGPRKAPMPVQGQDDIGQWGGEACLTSWRCLHFLRHAFRCNAVPQSSPTQSQIVARWLLRDFESLRSRQFFDLSTLFDSSWSAALTEAIWWATPPVRCARVRRSVRSYAAGISLTPALPPSTDLRQRHPDARSRAGSRAARRRAVADLRDCGGRSIRPPPP